MKTVYNVLNDVGRLISTHRVQARAVIVAKRNPESIVVECLIIESGPYKGQSHQHRTVWPEQSANWYSN
jgi:hypothetical protein